MTGHPVPNLRRRTCPRSLPWCGSHVGNRRHGPCVEADMVIPVPGRVEAVVFRHLHPDGRRDADLCLRRDGRWSTALPLPDDPAPMLADVVGRARKFLAEATP